MDATTKNLVRQRAGDCCEYCHLPQDATPFITFHIEHARMQGDTPFFRVVSGFWVSDVIPFRYELTILIILSRRLLRWPDSRVRSFGVKLKCSVPVCLLRLFAWDRQKAYDRA